MGLIEKLTRTHMELDSELSHFGRALENHEVRPQTRAAFEELRAALVAVHELLERHIRTETSLEERSDSVLGDGSMKDYGVPAHQERMRKAVRELRSAIEERAESDALRSQFEAFVAQFERYSDAEWEFLQENASVLYPGGAVD